MDRRAFMATSVGAVAALACGQAPALEERSSVLCDWSSPNPRRSAQRTMIDCAGLQQRLRVAYPDYDLTVAASKLDQSDLKGYLIHVDNLQRQLPDPATSETDERIVFVMLPRMENQLECCIDSYRFRKMRVHTMDSSCDPRLEWLLELPDIKLVHGQAVPVAVCRSQRVFG